MSKRILSMALVLIMVLSLLPVTGVAATETTNETQQSSTPAEQAATEPDVKIGVLSDIHVSFDYTDETYGDWTGYFNGVQPGRLEKALRFFKSQGVDAVVIAGDLQESGGTDAETLAKSKVWLQKVVDIWYEVFPEAPGEEGYVEPIFTYGNHDTGLIADQYWPSEWGTYQDVFVKEVNGYSFICTHNAKESLAAPLLEEIVPENEDKPVFYIQHCPVYNTVPSSTSGYGVGYGQAGWKNVAPYHNVVVLNGHTHVPLTDERSIWQGDGGNEGQFTVLNTATINYSGLGNENLNHNSANGSANDTEHGMIISVTGSDVSVDRYSFNDMTLDDATNTISGEADKLGETWAWDACDITDRPYAYDNMVENSAAPEFSGDAEITVDSITSTSVTVTIPAASLTPNSGFSDMIEGYYLEACNPVTGEVEALGTKATSYHVDDEEGCYADTYTITVSGLNPGTEYLLRVYAQEFYDVKSNVLTATVTTSGERTYQRTGDINNDGKINDADLTLLQQILAAQSTYEAAADVDKNGVLETKDLAALQAILAGGKLTFDSDDLMDKVVEVKFSSGNEASGKYGAILQNSVVHGASNQAVKTWTVQGLGYPYLTMYFDEPVDLSEFTHLSFDAMFENTEVSEYPYGWRWLAVYIISGEQEQAASGGSMNVDQPGVGWDTKTVSLIGLKNVDLTAVTGIKFQLNYDTAYDAKGYYDGVTERVVYVDNIHGVYSPATDNDLSATATLTGGEAIYGAGYTKNTNEAVKSTGGTLDVMFDKAMHLNDYAGFTVQMRTPGTYTVTVQALDAEGNPIGTATTVESYYIYKEKFISVPAMAVEDGVYAKGLRFTYSCEHLLIDTLGAKLSRDYDLVGASNITVSDGFTWKLTTEVTNGSNNSLYVTGEGNVTVTLTPEAAVNMSNFHYLRLDAQFVNADAELTVTLLDGEGAQIATYTISDGSYAGDFARYEIDLLKLTTADKLTAVAKIQIAATLAADGELWIDNVKAVNPVEDFFGAATTLVTPSAVQDGFECEIRPSYEGRDNVMYWHADPFNGGGTTSNWPGETVIYIKDDVQAMNHDGYSTDYDYLQFDIRIPVYGTYAVYITLKDASGATLGSTGEFRTARQIEWATFRVDFASLKMSAEDVAKIAQVSIGYNWELSNVTGSATLYDDTYAIDNMGFGKFPEANDEPVDYLDRVSQIRNSEYWSGGNNVYPGAGWLYEAKEANSTDHTFKFYRSAETNGMGYENRGLYAYLTDYVTVESDWVIMLNVTVENFKSGATLAVVGSDGKNYSCFTFSGTGTYKLSKNVSELVASDSTVFDPSTTTIKGFKYTVNYNRSNDLDATKGGYILMDNLWILNPEDIPEPVTLDILESATSVTLTDEAAGVVGEGFVTELLETYGDRTFVFHQYSDPANNGGVTGNYVYAKIEFTADAIANPTKYDFFEFELKNTNLYCDSFYVNFYNAAGTKLGGLGERYTTTSDWAYYCWSLDAVGLTSDEIAQIAYVQITAQWSNQLTTKETPLVGELYVDNMGFGSNLEDSTDLFDHVIYVDNVEWWWSGNNTYGNQGWQMPVDENGSRSFMFYRYENWSNGAGYDPRRHYLYFDSPITLTEDMSIAIDATITDMGTGSKISFLGSDGNKYGYLLLNQTGTHTYEMAASDLVLLNADTHLTTTTTPIDMTTVTITGVILHCNYSSGDATVAGSVVLDNFRIGEFATEATEVASDWFYGAGYNAGGFTAAKTYLSIDPTSTDFVNGNQSKYSYKFGYDGGNVDGSIDYWPHFYLTFATNTVDVSGKKLLIDVYVDTEATGTTGLTLRNIVDTGWNSITEEVNTTNGTSIGFTLNNNEWTTIEIDFSSMTEIEGKSLSAVHMMNFQITNTLGVAKYYYFDNARLVDPDYEETTEPTTEATTVPETEPAADLNDLLAGATAADSRGFFSGGNFTYDFNSDVVYGEDSVRSLRLSWSTESNEETWPVAMLSLNQSVDMTGKFLVMDVKIEMPVGIRNQQMSITASDSSWGSVASTNLYVNGPGWRTVKFDLTAGLLEGKDLTDVCFLSLNTALGSANGNYNIYIDNVRLEDRTDANMTTEIESDLLAAARTEWSGSEVNGNTFLADYASTETYGDKSFKSFSFSTVSTTGSGAPTVQVHLNNKFDITGKALAFDVKFTNAVQTVKVTLYNEWSQATEEISLRGNGSTDWQTIVIPAGTIAAKQKDGVALDQLMIITFGVDFTSDVSGEHRVTIDNLRTVTDNQVLADDWVYMAMDWGQVTLQANLTDEMSYGNDSGISMKLVNDTDGEKRVYWSPESQYGNANVPSFNPGFISAYFYFGDQTPAGYFVAVDKDWKSSYRRDITFVDVGDGWYYGTVNTTSLLTTGSQLDLSKIIRYIYYFPAGYTVYMDEVKFHEAETAAEDWTNMVLDVNSAYVTMNDQYTYGDSKASVRFDATTKTYFSFNSASEAGRTAAKSGSWDGYPDLSDSTLSCYIYFGDQTPYAKIEFTDPKWGGAAGEMTLEDVGDGWYKASIDTSTLTMSDPTYWQQVIRIYMTFTQGQIVYIDNMTVTKNPNPLEDLIANATSVTKPGNTQENFVNEVLATTDDGRTNVVYWYSDPNNNGGVTNNWATGTKVYISAVPSYVDTTGYDYVEFEYKHIGTTRDLTLWFYNTAGTKIATTETMRCGHTSGWVTYRCYLNYSDGYSAADLANLSYVQVSMSYEYQNPSSSDPQVGEFYLDNLRFGSAPADVTNILAQVAYTSYQAGHYYDSTGYSLLLDSEGDGENINSLKIHRSMDITYTWTNFTFNFAEGITVDADWVFSVDYVWNNFHSDPTLQLIDSNGTKYTVAKPNNKVSRTLTTTLADAGVADGTVITGIYYSYSLGVSSDITEDGYIYWNNMTLTDPTPAE